MNALVSLYPGDDAVRVAASVAVQIAGVVLLSLAAGWTVARRNAALRHGIWLAALAWVCIAPVAAWGLQRAGITVWRTVGWHWPARRPLGPASAGSRTDIGNAHHSDSVGADESSAVRTAQPRRPAATLDVARRMQGAASGSVPSEPQAAGGTAFEAAFGALTTVWAAGAMLLLARLVWGVRVVASIRRELIPFGDLPGDVTDRLLRTLRVKALPPIMLSRRVGGPATIGLRRSIVVLPAELAAAMTASELRDALAHECAHALRHDARIALVQQFMAAIYWLHPLVHVLNRQLARAREETCDNVVLSGTTAADYARTLLSLSQTMQAARGRIAVVQMFDKRWRLAHRVAGLLNTRRIVMTRVNRRAVALVAGVALAFGTTLAAISTAGDQPESTKAVPAPGLSPKSVLADPPITEPSKDSGKATAPGHFTKIGQDWSDQEWHKAIQEPRFEERKAELDIKEAKAVLESKNLEYQLLADSHAKVTNSVTLLELDRAKSSVRVAEVHLEQAELALERAHLKVEQHLPGVFYAGPALQNGQGEFLQQNIGLDPTVRELKVKDVITALHPNLDKVGAMRVALIRFKGTIGETISAADELKPTDGVTIRDLLAGKAKNEVVHRGDFIVVLPTSAETPPSAKKPKETPKSQSNKEKEFVKITGTGILVKGNDAGESAGTIAALTDIDGIDKTVHLTDDQKKVLARIIEAQMKTQRAWMKENAKLLEKLKAAENAWVDAAKGHDKAAIANAQKEYEDALAPVRDLEKKEQQELAAVLTPAQRAMLREHDIATFLEWTIGPVKLSDEQRRKFREALNEVKETDYEPWERSERRLFIVEKIVVGQILTPEQKRTIFKHDAMEAIKLSLPGADLSPEQLTKVDAAIDDLVKDQNPTLNGFRGAAAYKIVEAVRALLSDEQTQKVQAELKEQNQKFKAALKARSNRE